MPIRELYLDAEGILKKQKPKNEITSVLAEPTTLHISFLCVSSFLAACPRDRELSMCPC